MKTKIVLFCIITLFLLTRLYRINEIPPSVYWDEASIGYNAYSVLKTGKDEWGEFLPLHFRAFGEFKLPIFIYSVVPFVAIFGLNEFSVRIPSVIFSLGVVIITYFLAKKITGSNAISLWSSFFVTISPWFFIFSRTGFEATAGLLFYLLGILFFLHKADGNFILFSIISFILSAYSYNSFRIIIPPTVLILIFMQRDCLRKISLHFVLLSFVVVAISIWPIYRLYVYDVGFFRLQAVGGVDAQTFVKNYFSHFSLDFLLSGDKNLRHQQSGFGQVYPIELLLIFAGIIYMLKNKLKYGWLPFVLILLAPIPASITKESPHALRAISAVPFIAIISAVGVAWIRGKIIKVFLAVILLGFFTNYFINFLTIYPASSEKDWQFEYKKIFTDKRLGEKDHVMASDEFGQPYIFALFYLKYDPQKFRDEVVRNPVDKWGFSTVKSFGKFEFGNNE